MKKIIITIILAAWTILFMVLTLQNGIDTTNTSKGLTEFLINLFGLNADEEAVHGMLRHAAHIIFLAGEGIILFIALHAAKIRLGKNLMITCIACLAFAIFTEAIKIGIVGRHFSWTDVGLNLIGAVAGITIGLIFVLSKPQESVVAS